MLPVTMFAAEEAPEGIGALGLSLSSFLIQLVTFVLVYLVLRKFAFGPIITLLQQRRDTIEEGVQLGEAMRKQKAETDAAVAAELKKARKDADDIVNQAHTSARQTVAEAEDEARSKADGIVADGKDRAEQEVSRARKKLEGELVGLVAEATEVIIGEKVDAKKDAALIDRALKGRQRA